MKCKNCGYEIDEKEKLEKCPNCNEKLEKDYGNPRNYLIAFLLVLVGSVAISYITSNDLFFSIGLYLGLVVISITKSRFKNNIPIQIIFWIYVGFLILMVLAIIFTIVACVGSCAYSLEQCSRMGMI